MYAPTLVSEFSSELGRRLKAATSHQAGLHINLKHTEMLGFPVMEPSGSSAYGGAQNVGATD